MRAQLDQVLWTASCVSGAMDLPQYGARVSVYGLSRASLSSDATINVSFNVPSIEPGTYVLPNSYQQPNGLNAIWNSAFLSFNCISHPLGSCPSWSITYCCGGRGTITLTDVSTTGAAGTFALEFDGSLTNDRATGAHTVSNGEFRVTF
jgi:hypothetical protein